MKIYHFTLQSHTGHSAPPPTQNYFLDSTSIIKNSKYSLEKLLGNYEINVFTIFLVAYLSCFISKISKKEHENFVKHKEGLKTLAESLVQMTCSDLTIFFKIDWVYNIKRVFSRNVAFWWIFWVCQLVICYKTQHFCWKTRI